MTDPTYWKPSPSDPETLQSTGQPGPPVVVLVNPDGVQVRVTVGTINSNAARWLGVRLIEAAAIHERMLADRPGQSPDVGIDRFGEPVYPDPWDALSEYPDPTAIPDSVPWVDCRAVLIDHHGRSIVTSHERVGLRTGRATAGAMPLELDRPITFSLTEAITTDLVRIVFFSWDTGQQLVEFPLDRLTGHRSLALVAGNYVDVKPKILLRAEP